MNLLVFPKNVHMTSSTSSGNCEESSVMIATGGESIIK